MEKTALPTALLLAAGCGASSAATPSSTTAPSAAQPSATSNAAAASPAASPAAAALPEARIDAAIKQAAAGTVALEHVGGGTEQAVTAQFDRALDQLRASATLLTPTPTDVAGRAAGAVASDDLALAATLGSILQCFTSAASQAACDEQVSEAGTQAKQLGLALTKLQPCSSLSKKQVAALFTAKS